jgi:large subunit ribosomal protein L6
MSRTGNTVIKVPEKIKITIKDSVFLAEGPKGKEEVKINPLVSVDLTDGELKVKRANDSKEARCIHGLMRSLMNNAVIGVAEGFKKNLEINGVGYRAQVQGKVLKLNLGFSHDVMHSIPEGIKVTVSDQTKVEVFGSNKELVGQVSSQIRAYRPPEPYKGKGVKYSDETIIRKVGKAAGGK